MLGYVARINSHVYRHSRPVIEVDHVTAPRTGEICGNFSLRYDSLYSYITVLSILCTESWWLADCFSFSRFTGNLYIGLKLCSISVFV